MTFSKSDFFPNLTNEFNSHGGGLSLYRAETVKSILLESFSLNFIKKRFLALRIFLLLKADLKFFTLADPIDRRGPYSYFVPFSDSKY